MNTQLALWCFLMAVLGQGVHIFLLKIPAGKKRAQAANAEYSVIDFFKEDWTNIIGTFMVVVMLLIGFGEVVHWRPESLNIARWLFAFVGFCGSSIILSLFSKYEKLLLNMIDKKTNIADSVRPDAVSNVITENKSTP